jgi:hypothetical protein
MKKPNLIILFLFLLLFFKSLYAIEEHTRFWSSANVLGSFSSNNRLKYYLEPQLRFIDDSSKFNQAIMVAGLGYQPSENVVILGGLGGYLIKNLQGEMLHEYRLWEQLSVQIPTLPTYDLFNRIRLEQRDLLGEAGIAWRLRERLLLRIPLRHWPDHSLVTFDEIFMNLNRPKWVVPHFFDQNRAFFGIGTQLSKTSILDIGYLNQYIMSSPHQLGNVLLVNLTVVD